MPGSTTRRVWVHVKNELLESVHSEQAFCSLVAEMLYMPTFQHQPALAELHRKNFETSHRRNTVAGNLARLQAGEEHEALVFMTIEYLVKTAMHDTASTALLAQLTADTPDDQVWLRAAAHWHESRQLWTRRAAATLKANIAADLWEHGLALAE